MVYEVNFIELVEEMQAINDLLNDDDVEDCLQLIVNFIAKPDVPPIAARNLVLKLQSISGKFSMMALFYRTIGNDKTARARHKKDAYYSLRDVAEKLADAMKYQARI